MKDDKYRQKIGKHPTPEFEDAIQNQYQNIKYVTDVGRNTDPILLSIK
jgi:hypothetical protein